MAQHAADIQKEAVLEREDGGVAAVSRRIKFIYFFSLVGIVSCLIFGPYNIVLHNYSPAFFEIGGGMLAAVNLIFLRRSGDIEKSSSFVLVLMYVLLLSLFFTGGIEGTGIFWFYTFPTLAFFLKGARRGAWWVGGLYALSFAAFIFHLVLGTELPFPYTTVQQLWLSLLAVSLLVYFYQNINEKNQALIEKRTQALQESREMREEILVSLNEEKTKIDSEVKWKTRALAEERARLIASLSGLSVGIVLSDVCHMIIFKNAVAASLLGLSDHDMNLGDIIRHFRTKFDLAASVEESISQKIPIKVDDLPFGDKFLRIFISPIILTEDREAVVGSVMLIEDITASKALERSKDEFLAIASHEMRTPLTIIRGNAELILASETSKNFSEDDKKMLTTVYNNSTRLMDIVNDFLDVINLEQGKLRFKPETIDVPALLKETVADFKGKAEAKHLYLKLDFPEPDSFKVIADRERLKEIIINFIANALQYTEHGGVTVSIGREDSSIKVLFSDTGVGIKPETQAYLFQKLQTIGEHFIHSREYGSGLGLYINKLLAEAMDGSVALEKSEVGAGSTFSMTLPAALEKAKN